MAKLLVKDKDGVEREVTQKAYDLVGHKYGYKILGKAEEPQQEKSEVQKAMEEMKARKAAEQESKTTIASDTPEEFHVEHEESVEAQPEPKKRGRKPKAQAQ